MEQTHTALPWRIYYTGSRPIIERDMGQGDTLADNAEFIAEFNGDDEGARRPNAEYTLKACNSHDALVTALRLTTEVLETLTDDPDTEPGFQIADNRALLSQLEAGK